jgi:membrane fusion protein, multidrug efflux system
MAAARSTLGAAVTVAALAALVVTGLLTWHRLDRRPRTDDAYLQADLVHVAPDVSGRIIELDVSNNQRVHKGDVLFRIDPVPYHYRLEQARASVAALESKVSVTTDQVASQVSRADAARTSVGNARAQLALATSTLQRLLPLLGHGYVTAQKVDEARTAQRSAEITLQASEQQATEARQAVESVKPVEGELEATRQQAELAAWELDRTVVSAPCDGLITALETVAGEYAAAGHPLFTIIDTAHWYATGNFRETDLAGTKPGHEPLKRKLTAHRFRPIATSQQLRMASKAWRSSKPQSEAPKPAAPGLGW